MGCSRTYWDVIIRYPQTFGHIMYLWNVWLSHKQYKNRQRGGKLHWTFCLVMRIKWKLVLLFRITSPLLTSYHLPGWCKANSAATHFIFVISCSGEQDNKNGIFIHPSIFSTRWSWSGSWWIRSLFQGAKWEFMLDEHSTHKERQNEGANPLTCMILEETYSATLS